MRSVDLALYADALAGEAASLAARIERERGKQRQTDVERAARRELPASIVQRLTELGLLATKPDALALVELEEALDAVEALRSWVEEALDRAAAGPWTAGATPGAGEGQPRCGVSATSRPPSSS